MSSQTGHKNNRALPKTDKWLSSPSHFSSNNNHHYSSNKTTDMGIPQGSIIAPILFNMIIHDLPKALSNNRYVAQYADDIAIWVNTTLRKHTNKRVVSHVQKLYQLKINKLTAYMKDNGFELSQERCCLLYTSPSPRDA